MISEVLQQGMPPCSSGSLNDRQAVFAVTVSSAGCTSIESALLYNAGSVSSSGDARRYATGGYTFTSRLTPEGEANQLSCTPLVDPSCSKVVTTRGSRARLSREAALLCTVQQAFWQLLAGTQRFT